MGTDDELKALPLEIQKLVLETFPGPDESERRDIEALKRIFGDEGPDLRESVLMDRMFGLDIVKLKGGSLTSLELAANAGRTVIPQYSQKCMDIVGAVFGSTNHIRTHRFSQGEEEVNVPFVEYQNGMRYVPATDELTCNLRLSETGLSETGLVLESGYHPYSQRFIRCIEKPDLTVSNGITIDQRVTALTYWCVDPADGQRDIAGNSFNISALDAWFESSGKDTRGFSVLYTWKGCYDPNKDSIATPVCKRDVHIHHGDYTWVCDFTEDGILYQAKLRRTLAGDKNDPADLKVILFDRKNPPIGQLHIDESVDNHEIRLRGLLERYQLTHAIYNRVDWDVTLRNIIAENSAVLAYVGE